MISKALEELKKVEGAPLCSGCKHFNFDLKKGHYYLDETTMEGECTHLPKEKVGTTSMSRGCKHWEIKTT